MGPKKRVFLLLLWHYSPTWTLAPSILRLQIYFSSVDFFIGKRVITANFKGTDRSVTHKDKRYFSHIFGQNLTNLPRHSYNNLAPIQICMLHRYGNGNGKPGFEPRMRKWQPSLCPLFPPAHSWKISQCFITKLFLHSSFINVLFSRAVNR